MVKSKKEWKKTFKLVEQYMQMTNREEKRAFLKKHEVKNNTMSYWKKKYEEQHATGSASTALSTMSSAASEAPKHTRGPGRPKEHHMALGTSLKQVLERTTDPLEQMELVETLELAGYKKNEVIDCLPSKENFEEVMRVVQMLSEHYELKKKE